MSKFFSLKSARDKETTLTKFIQQWTRDPRLCSRAKKKKKKKTIRIINEEIKQSLFADYMFLHSEIQRLYRYNIRIKK